MEFEFDIKSLLISLPFSLVFIVAMWKVPAWTESVMFTWQIRVIISILLPMILYFIVMWQINK